MDRANLTDKERSLLKAPDWTDEEEADAVMTEKIVQKEGHTGIPFREYLKRNGRAVED